jgi:hypothetical protein
MVTFQLFKFLSYSLTYIPAESQQSPGSAPVDVRVIRERSGYDREQPEYIRNSAGNVLDDPGTSGIRSRME